MSRTFRPAILGGDAVLAHGRPYAERADIDTPWHDRLALGLHAALLEPLRQRLLSDEQRMMRAIAEATHRHDLTLQAETDDQLRQRLPGLRARLRRQGFDLPLVGECFSLIREAAGRTLGLRHHDTQLMAGWALLQGQLAEMATGEGKTFAGTLAAATMALSGSPVHVITVNDYLAERDAAKMAPLYRFLGLEVGVVVQGMARPERRQAYACAITYCTNKELAFDYLRDRVATQKRASRMHLALQRLGGDARDEPDLVLRGLHFAIVDEADSVFIDEARTPLILSVSRDAAKESADADAALALASQLVQGQDFSVNLMERRVRLTPAGCDKLADFAQDRGGVWTSVRGREELIHQALSAQWLYARDHHYVVTDGKVQIVDESTGRVMPDRSWERGLHQLIEVKEGVDPTARRETLARVTYQRLFRRYLRLSGMTGTGTEVAREIAAVYRLKVVKVPLHKPSVRQHLPHEVHADLDGKWQRVADITADLAQTQGRPVLIGTRSVKASEDISRLLTERGIEHALINAKQDQTEADVIARAGEMGRVTVATNMAGRGTDIQLGPGVAERGGLHVILTEFHDSRRVDRQLFGRSARQGDPGSCQAVVSLQDELFEVGAPTLSARLRHRMTMGRPLPPWLFQALKAHVQWMAERRHAQMRMHNLKQDQRLNQMLAFSGSSE